MQFVCVHGKLWGLCEEEVTVTYRQIISKKKLPIVKFGAVIQYAFASSLHLDALHEEF